MNRGNNPTNGLQRQTSGGSTGDSAPGTLQQAAVPQQITLQQSPVPQFMLATGPLQGVSLQTSHQQGSQLLGALSQGLQVASPTQSPNTFPHGMITTYSPEPVVQSGSGQLRTSGVAVTQAASTPSTPPVGMVANVLQHQLGSPAGLVMVPSLPGSNGYPSTAFVAGGSGAATTFIVQRQPAVEVGGSNLPEFQMLQQQVAMAFPSTASTGSLSATGGTVHHLGQNPRRAGASPLASPAAQQSNLTKGMNFQQQKQQQVVGSGVGVSSPLKARASSHGIAQSPDRPLKRIKLEEQPAPSEEAAQYRKLICDVRLKEMMDVKGSYIEHLTELFFLQNGGNVIDYFAWKKRPTMQLLHFLRSGNLDSEEEEEEQEQSINNEVKVLTSSGSSTPIATPVAISTTLPPAITALQQQQGLTTPAVIHSSTDSSQATGSSTPTVTNGDLPAHSSALAQIMQELPPASSSAATLHKCATAPAAIGNVALMSGSRTPGSPPRKQFDISAVCDTPLGSQEAIVERAKQVSCITYASYIDSACVVQSCQPLWIFYNHNRNLPMLTALRKLQSYYGNKTIQEYRKQYILHICSISVNIVPIAAVKRIHHLLQLSVDVHFSKCVVCKLVSSNTVLLCEHLTFKEDSISPLQSACSRNGPLIQNYE